MVSQSSLPVTHTKLRNGLWCVSLINPFPNIPASYSLPSPGFKCLYYLVHAKLLQSCPTLWDPIYCDLPGSSVHGDSPGKNTAVGCHVLLQGIFLTQGLNPGLPHCRQILYHLSHEGSPRILEWVVYLFSRGSSWPRNWTRVSCIAGGFFTS